MNLFEELTYRGLINDISSEDLKEKLLATGDKILIEGNTWNDDFWGKCSDNGKNNLGIILMKIREEIKKEL